ITDALARFDRVELRGFGVFSTKQRRARTGRNPRTGDNILVTEKHLPAFRTGKEVHELLKLNRRGSGPSSATGALVVTDLAPTHLSARRQPFSEHSRSVSQLAAF